MSRQDFANNERDLSTITPEFLDHVASEVTFWYDRPAHLLGSGDLTLARLRGLAGAIVALIDDRRARELEATETCYELYELNDADALIAASVV